MVGQIATTLQVLLCFVLLVKTMLLVITLLSLKSIDLGLRSAGLLLFRVNPRIQDTCGRQDNHRTPELLAKARRDYSKSGPTFVDVWSIA
jgi:hypothetical protein